jgi:hypothetical protein
MTQQFLDRADVVAVFARVGRQPKRWIDLRMTEGVDALKWKRVEESVWLGFAHLDGIDGATFGVHGEILLKAVGTARSPSFEGCFSVCQASVWMSSSLL